MKDQRRNIFKQLLLHLLRESISFLAVLFTFEQASNLSRSNNSFEFKSKTSLPGLWKLFLEMPLVNSCRLLHQVGKYWQYLVCVFLPLFLIGWCTLLIGLRSSPLLQSNEKRFEKVISGYLLRLQVFLTFLDIGTVCNLQVFLTFLGIGTVCHSLEVL